MQPVNREGCPRTLSRLHGVGDHARPWRKELRASCGPDREAQQVEDKRGSPVLLGRGQVGDMPKQRTGAKLSRRADTKSLPEQRLPVATRQSATPLQRHGGSGTGLGHCHSGSATRSKTFALGSTKFIVIGNPGTGKSTSINCYVEQHLFKSGPSRTGRGVTFQLDQRKSKDGRTFLDTPGLSDITMRKQAAAAIDAALQDGGDFKIIFFALTDDGRWRNDDLTTMKLVIDATRGQISEDQYAIVVNKCEDDFLEELEEPNHVKEDILSTLYAACATRKVPSTRHILFAPMVKALKRKDDVVMPLDPAVKDFLDACPTLSINPDEVDNVRHEEFEEMQEQFDEALRKKEEELVEEGRLRQAAEKDASKAKELAELKERQRADQERQRILAEKSVEQKDRELAQEKLDAQKRELQQQQQFNEQFDRQRQDAEREREKDRQERKEMEAKTRRQDELLRQRQHERELELRRQEANAKERERELRQKEAESARRREQERELRQKEAESARRREQERHMEQLERQRRREREQDRPRERPRNGHSVVDEVVDVAAKIVPIAKPLMKLGW